MSEALAVDARRRGQAVRSFFAWMPPDPAKQALAALARELRARPGGDAVRWVRPESYHVTLRFLGNVAATALAALVECVGEAVAGSTRFTLKLGAPQAFPPGRQPRVVVIQLEPEAPLAALAERIEAGVVAAGLPAERRRFRAHLTLGRVRSRRLPPLDAPVPDLGSLDVSEVVLFQSDLGEAGSRYTPLARIPLPESL